jgi:hypothetical protein
MKKSDIVTNTSKSKSKTNLNVDYCHSRSQSLMQRWLISSPSAQASDTIVQNVAVTDTEAISHSQAPADVRADKVTSKSASSGSTESAEVVVVPVGDIPREIRQGEDQPQGCCDASESRSEIGDESDEAEAENGDRGDRDITDGNAVSKSNSKRSHSSKLTQHLSFRADNSIKLFRQGNRNFVVCSACVKYPDVVKIHSKKVQVPPIAKPGGTRYRTEVVESHCRQPYHAKCLKAFRLSTLSKVEISTSSAMGKLVSKANEKLANKIGGLLINAYGDAKKLTLSAYSYPARVVVSKIATSFEFNSSSVCGDSSESTHSTGYSDLQYLTPSAHKEFLECIVESDRDRLARKLTTDVMALSIRCDGSVDRTRIDKIYVMAKVVTQSGCQEQYFLGASEPRIRGAKGVLGAVEDACIKTVGKPTANHIFRNASSIVTDGASVNTGEKEGFWTLFEAKRNESEDNLNQDISNSSIPLLKIWCGVHRSNLAWKSARTSVVEVEHTFQTLVGLSTFFHSSGLRSRELKDVAETNNCCLNTLPPLFEVRWTQFNYSLVNSVLTSWECLVLFFKKSKDKEATGFLSFLLDSNNLTFLACLADILAVFSRYQKHLQSDRVTILTMDKLTTQLKAKLRGLIDNCLLGGWVEALKEQMISHDDGSLMLKGIQLSKVRNMRRKTHHLYVTDKRNVNAVCTEVILSLVEYLEQRFEMDADIVRVIKPFAELQPTTSCSLKDVHKLLGSDLDLTDLSLEYEELLAMDNLDNARKMALPELVLYLASSGSYRTATTVMARILAAKPHSADVERLISTSTTLKSIKRSSMSIETENEYLYVYNNMPALIEWDPRPAVLFWLKQREHRNRGTPKGKEQAWFHGILSESSKHERDSDDDDINEENHDIGSKSKRRKF